MTGIWVKQAKAEKVQRGIQDFTLQRQRKPAGILTNGE